MAASALWLYLNSVEGERYEDNLMYHAHFGCLLQNGVPFVHWEVKMARVKLEDGCFSNKMLTKWMILLVKVLDKQKGLNFECKWFLCQKLKGNIPL